MLIYNVIITVILAFFIVNTIYSYYLKNKKRKIDSLFYEDFYDLVPQFKETDFSSFVKKNTFIINVQNNRFDSRFKDIPSEKSFLKIFKKSLPKNVNVHYCYKNAYLSFVISFDCDEIEIVNALENIAERYPTMHFGLSQCLKPEMIYSAIKNNITNQSIKVLSSKYYGNSKKASDMGLFNKKNVYRFDVSENKVLTGTNIEAESQLMTAIKCKNIGEVNETILKCFENADNYSQCMYISNNLLFFLHNLLAKHNLSVAEVYGDNVNLYRWVSGTTRKKGLIESIQSWFKKAVLYIDDHSEKTNNIELKIEKYIEDNYSNDISITTMAEEFNVSTQYFSKYFKSQTGNTFLDTLNRYRIKKALEILNETDLSMAEIAAMTGFNNYKSFSRNFKKYTGKIPSEYTKK